MSNPDWPLASEVAKEMGDDTPTNTRRVLSEMKRIREAGQSVVIAVACWRAWKKSLNDAGLSTPRLASVLKDRRLELFITDLYDRLPPVYDSSQHDQFVLDNHEALNATGFVYLAGRLPIETLDSLGVRYE